MKKQTSQQEVLSVIDAIIDYELSGTPCVGDGDYIFQRNVIKDVFNSPFTLSNIFIRLVVIDSCYSTTATRTHYALSEMAKAIYNLGKAGKNAANKEKLVCDYFYGYVMGNVPAYDIFQQHFGIRKNLDKGPRSVSLLSKYAYFSLLMFPANYPLGFPIYDKLAREMYPKACSLMGITPQNIMKNPDIYTHISALNNLRMAIFGAPPTLYRGYQQYDLLDAYLWRMGKFSTGRLALLFTMNDYIKLITNLGLLKSKDFDKEVKKRLLASKNPFKGLCNRNYYKLLLDHWRKYYQP